MKSKSFLGVGLIILLCALCRPAVAAERPNLIWIMADDLGYGELGCYGQKLIQTPQSRPDGARGDAVHAVLCGRDRVRTVAERADDRPASRPYARARQRRPIQSDRTSPAPDDATVARLLHDAGYRTALVGKWGLGDVGPAEIGLPRKQGFDYFFGYLNQRHAHNHFPDFLWRNRQSR